MKRLKLATLVLLLVVAICLGAWGARRPVFRALALHWHDRLSVASDDQVDALVARICALGEPGLPALVRALGSKREAVARSARRAITHEMDRWESLGATEISPKLAILAAELAEHSPKFGPAARLDAARLATRILTCPVDRDAIDNAGLLADCQAVLRATTVPRRLAEDQPVLDRLRYVEPGESRDSGPGPRTGPSEACSTVLRSLHPVPMGELPLLPGGGLPIETYPVEDGSPSGPQMVRLLPERPRRFDDRSPAKPLNPLRQPRRFRESEGATALRDSADAPRAATPEPDTVRPLSLDRPLGADLQRLNSPETAESEIVDLGAEDEQIVQWMRQLRSEEGGIARRARSRLIERGFSEVQLQLARQLFHPDPAARIQLARTLPGLRSIDARPWLMWLAKDEEANVRLAAITLLATTGDPELLSEVVRLAERDLDPRIQAQAAQIAENALADPYEIRLRKRR